MHYADNGAAVGAYAQKKLRSALKSPFTVMPYTALSPSAARWNNTVTATPLSQRFDVIILSFF